MPLELSGRQYILERLETSRVYIPTHKTYFQVGRTPWLSWAVRLKRNSDILSSILDGGEYEKTLFWPLLDPSTRVGAWASFMDSENIREPLIPGRINLEHCSNPHFFATPQKGNKPHRKEVVKEGFLCIPPKVGPLRVHPSLSATSAPAG